MSIMTLSPNELISEELTTTSLKVAEVFDKQHKDVMKKISLVDCSEEFSRRNFAPTSYIDGFNREQKATEMTKDGFIFLVMSFTGKKAAEIKEKYIEAFNWMEQQLKNGSMTVPVTPSHKADHIVSASRTFGGLLRAAKTMGMSQHRALASANKSTERATGVNLVDELEAHDLLEEPPTQQYAEQHWVVPLLNKWIGDKKSFTNLQLWEGLGEEVMKKTNKNTIGAVLKRMGWHRRQCRVQGIKGLEYFRLDDEELT